MSGLPQRQFLLNIFLRYTFFIHLIMFCWKWNILSSIMWHHSKSDSSPPPMFVFVVGCCCYLLSNFPELILWSLYFVLLVVIKVFTQFSHWSTNYWDRDFFKSSEPGSLLAFAEEFDVHFGICLKCDSCALVFTFCLCRPLRLARDESLGLSEMFPENVYNPRHGLLDSRLYKIQRP